MTDTSNAPELGVPDGQQPTRLTPQQESIREALAAKSAEAAGLYVSGIRVLADDRNPCAVRLAGGAMRELVDELARAAGVVKLRARPLPDRINALRQRVNKRARLLRVEEPTLAHVESLLTELDEFFAEYDEINPSRKVRARQAVAGLGAAGPDVPAVVLDPTASDWIEFSDRFSGVLHAPTPPDRSEFQQLLADFEAFLVSWLSPPTIDDYSAIDDLIAEGPPNA